MINLTTKEKTMNKPWQVVVEKKYIDQVNNEIKNWNDINVGAIIYADDLGEVIFNEKLQQESSEARMKQIRTGIDYFHHMISVDESLQKHGEQGLGVHAVSVYNLALDQLKKDLAEEQYEFARSLKVVELAKIRKLKKEKK